MRKSERERERERESYHRQIWQEPGPVRVHKEGPFSSCCFFLSISLSLIWVASISIHTGYYYTATAPRSCFASRPLLRSSPDYQRLSIGLLGGAKRVVCLIFVFFFVLVFFLSFQRTWCWPSVEFLSLCSRIRKQRARIVLSTELVKGGLGVVASIGWWSLLGDWPQAHPRTVTGFILFSVLVFNFTLFCE